MFSLRFIFLLDKQLVLFIFILPACKGAIIRTQQKGGQTMMIMFQRQIETVGSHQALISRVADRAKRRCNRIRFHRRQGCVSRQRGARLQTDKRCKWRPHQVHCAFRNNEILGGWGDPDRHYEIIHFHPLAETTGLLVLTAQTVWLSQAHILHPTYSVMNKRLNQSQKHICQDIACWWQQSWLTITYKNTQLQPTFAWDEIAVELFHFK